MLTWDESLLRAMKHPVFHYSPNYELWFIIMINEQVEMWGQCAAKSRPSPQLAIRDWSGSEERRQCTPNTLVSNLHKPLSSLLNCICQVVSQKCLTLSRLWVCDNWSRRWWSREYWLRKLHTTISKFDSFSRLLSLWWKGVGSKCGKHRSSHFCLTLPFDTTLIRRAKPLQLSAFLSDAIWCRLDLTYGKSDMINPVCVYLFMVLDVFGAWVLSQILLPLWPRRYLVWMPMWLSFIQPQPLLDEWPTWLPWKWWSLVFSLCSEPFESKRRIWRCMEALYSTPILIWPCGILLVFAWNPQALIISSPDVWPHCVPLVY